MQERKPGDAVFAPSASTPTPCRAEDVRRQIDAIEIAIILAAILQVVDDLQRCADRIGSRPGRRALAMHVEDEAPHRHRRKGAVRDQIVPVRVAPLDRVEPKSLEQVLRVPRPETAFGPARAAELRLAGSSPPVGEQGRLHPIQTGDFFLRGQIRVVGDVVGGADKIVERQNDRAVCGANKEGRDGKILLPVGLPRSRWVVRHGPSYRAPGNGSLPSPPHRRMTGRSERGGQGIPKWRRKGETLSRIWPIEIDHVSLLAAPGFRRRGRPPRDCAAPSAPTVDEKNNSVSKNDGNPQNCYPNRPALVELETPRIPPRCAPVDRSPHWLKRRGGGARPSMSETSSRPPPRPRPRDYAVVAGSRGPRRDFRISVGLREGWDAEGRVFDVSEAVRTARAWMKRRVEAGLPALSGMFTRAEVTYAWPRPDGPSVGPRAGRLFTGEAVHAYLGHLPDAAIEAMLNELATELGVRARSQSASMSAFAEQTWILDAGEREANDGDPPSAESDGCGAADGKNGVPREQARA